MSNNTGKNNPNYKDGRTLKNYYCKICNKEISIGAGIYGNQKINNFTQERNMI